MIIDSSAIIAILFKEKDHELLEAKFDKASFMGISAPTVVETGLVVSARLGKDARPLLAQFISSASIEVISFTHEHWQEAVRAFIRYGKGRHPAKLNFGDCMSYAVAKLSELPLLFIGGDFSLTDIAAA